MKVCFDTCSVVDILGESDWFFPAYCAYDVAVLRGFQPCLSVSSTTDICYLLHARGFLSQKRAREVMSDTFDLFDLFENTPHDCKLAIQSNMRSYEDALIAYSAHNAGVDIIITRNKKDFKDSPVPALTPEEFLRGFKPQNITYDKMELFPTAD